MLQIVRPGQRQFHNAIAITRAPSPAKIRELRKYLGAGARIALVISDQFTSEQVKATTGAIFAK